MPKLVYFLFQTDKHKHIIDGICKIGSTSRTVNHRIREMQTGNPDKLMCYAKLITQKHKELESWLHEKHSHVRRDSGEWFYLTTKDVDDLCNLFNDVTVDFTNAQPSNNNGPSIDNNPSIDHTPFINTQPSNNNNPSIDHTPSIQQIPPKNNNVVSSNQVFVCHTCRTPFNSLKKLERHFNNKMPCDFVCKICNHKSFSKRSYYYHLERDHT